MEGPICKIWPELKVEDDYEGRRWLWSLLTETSSKFAITWAIDLQFQIRKIREREHGKENSPVTLDWLQVHRKSHSTNEKQQEDFGDRLQRLEIDFQHDSFSQNWVFGFSQPARGLIRQEDFRKEVAATRGTDDGGGARVAARVRFWGEIGMGMRGGGALKLI
jgi:hypothetical protein